MVNTPAQAIKKAESIKAGYKGLCLVFVRTCYDIDVKYPSAASAWQHAKKKHVQSNLNGIPKGAPVFFSVPGNKYGHVALYLGNGNFRTNYSARGSVITGNLYHPAFSTMSVLGWTEDLNGVTIKGLSSGSSTYTVVKGDTLSGIGKKTGVAWPKIASLNGIKSPYTIFPGDKLTLK